MPPPSKPWAVLRSGHGLPPSLSPSPCWVPGYGPGKLVRWPTVHMKALPGGLAVLLPPGGKKRWTVMSTEASLHFTELWLSSRRQWPAVSTPHQVLHSPHPIVPGPSRVTGFICDPSPRVSKKPQWAARSHMAEFGPALNLLPLLRVHATEAEGGEGVMAPEKHPGRGRGRRIAGGSLS